MPPENNFHACSLTGWAQGKRKRGKNIKRKKNQNRIKTMLFVLITNLFWHREGDWVQGTLFKAASTACWFPLVVLFLSFNTKINTDISPSSYKKKQKWDGICGTCICFCYIYSLFSNMNIDINLSATIGRAIFKKMCKLWYVFLLFQNSWAHWTLDLFIAITPGFVFSFGQKLTKYKW